MEKRSGVTLVEVLVAASIGVMLMTAAYVMYMTSSASFDDARERVELNDQARRAMNAMVNELRWATRTTAGSPSPRLVIPSPPGNTQITFYLPHDVDGNGYYTSIAGAIEWDTTHAVVYQYVSASKILRRTYDGVSKTLADNVVGCTFSDIVIDPLLGTQELKVILSMYKRTPKGKIVSSSLTGMVRLRN